MPAAIAIPAIAAAVGGGASAAASIYGSNKSSRAARDAARYQTQQANYAAELEAKAAAEALAFAKDQEATRKAEFDKTQQRNYALHQEDLERREPYRQFGLGAIAGLQQPLYRNGRAPGTLGSLMRG